MYIIINVLLFASWRKMKKTVLMVIIATFLLAACSAQTASTAPAAETKATSAQPQATLVQPSAQPQATSVQPTVAATLAAAPSLSPDEVYQAVSAAWAKMAQAGPRHISQTTSEGLTTEVDVAPPDFHQVVTAGGTVVAEQYIVSGTIYNNVQGAWTQTAGGGDSLGMLGNLIPAVSDSLVYSAGKVEGIEVINGSPAILYSYSTTLKGVDASAQYKVWVNQASGLPVRFLNTTPDGSTIDESITYKTGLSITLPEEAKNAPASTD